MGDNLPIVRVLLSGYGFKDSNNVYHASGTVTLIELKKNHCILVDCGGCSDKKRLKNALTQYKIGCEDISYVICTHSHSDHIGNLNMFTNATHIVEREKNIGDIYLETILGNGDKYVLIPGVIELWSTPGHTSSDISVIILNGILEPIGWQGCIACVGDLFECKNDEDIWKKTSANVNLQNQAMANRLDCRSSIFLNCSLFPFYQINNFWFLLHI